MESDAVRRLRESKCTMGGRDLECECRGSTANTERMNGGIESQIHG